MSLAARNGGSKARSGAWARGGPAFLSSGEPAFGGLLALAAIPPKRRVVRISLAAYLVYAVPRFLFHLARAVIPGLQALLPTAILGVVSCSQKSRGGWVIKSPAAVLEPFVGQWAVLLTTYKRDGTPVGTTVNIVVEGITPTSGPGTPPGSSGASATTPRSSSPRRRRVGGPQDRRSGPGSSKAKGRPAPVARKYPVSHGVLVALIHRLRGNRTVHVELAPVGDPTLGCV